MAYNAETGKYITPVGRASFPVLVTPKPVGKNPKPGAKPKYQLTIVFDKEAQDHQDFKDLKLAVAAAADKKWGPKGSENRPRKIKSPFLTIEDLRNKIPEGYTEDHVFVRLNSEVKPQVVARRDGKLVQLTDEEVAREIYPGCNIKVSVDTYAWMDDDGGPGVSIGLGNVMKEGDNEPWGAAQTSAADDFGEPVSGTAAAAGDDFLD